MSRIFFLQPQAFGKPDTVTAKKTDDEEAADIRIFQDGVGTLGEQRGIGIGSAGHVDRVFNRCREGKDLQEEPCRLSDIRETCLLFGPLAEDALDKGAARQSSQTEMVAILNRADDVGLVLQPQNTQDPHFICCCCGCC